MPFIGAKEQSITAKTQADGAQEINLLAADSAMIHQIQVEVSAAPAAGVLQVECKTTGASGYVQLSDTINLTAIRLYLIQGIIESIRVTPVGFDGDKSYSVYVASAGLQ